MPSNARNAQTQRSFHVMHHTHGGTLLMELLSALSHVDQHLRWRKLWANRVRVSVHVIHNLLRAGLIHKPAHVFKIGW